LDGNRLIDKWRGGGISTDTVSVYLEEGRDYSLSVNMGENLMVKSFTAILD
jgi:hypothetical protein